MAPDDERTPDEVVEEPQPAPEPDLADEGGPTQAGAERGEPPTPRVPSVDTRR